MKIRTKAPHHLVALGSAAVIGVYSAGFLRTRAAAARFVDEPAIRRPIDPDALVQLANPLPAAGAGPSAGAPADALPPAPPASAPRASANASAPPASATAPAPPLASATPAVPAAAPASKAAEVKTASVPSSSAEPAVQMAAPRPAAAAANVPLAAAGTTAAADTTAASASPNSAAVAAPEPARPSKYVDGAYLGWGTSRHGDIQAKVVIEHDRIVSATIAQCLTRWDCSWISPLPPQVVARQSADVDFVSGATQSTNAFYYAVLEALSLAARR